MTQTLREIFVFRLQPLRVPAGWLVSYNDGLYEVDPSPHLPRWLFKEDLLQIRHVERNRLLDVGWYPDGNPEGQYTLVVYEGDFHDRLLHEFSTRDRLALVAEIERVLQAVTDGLL